MISKINKRKLQNLDGPPTKRIIINIGPKEEAALAKIQREIIGDELFSGGTISASVRYAINSLAYQLENKSPVNITEVKKG